MATTVDAERGLQRSEPFQYQESPWSESMAGIGARLAEVFPPRVCRQAGERTGVESNGSGLNPSQGSSATTAESDVPPGNGGELREAEERGRRAGLEEGFADGWKEAEAMVAAERNRLLAQGRALFESFHQAWSDFMHRMEPEAARLALAIAARILRHEAQIDPLLLTGAVRVAFGQLAEATEVRLWVPARDQPMWEEAMALIPGLSTRPQVIADDRMQLGECRVETGIGSANLSLWAQLKEMERSFFDRAAEGEAFSSAGGDGTAKTAAPEGLPQFPSERLAESEAGVEPGVEH